MRLAVLVVTVLCLLSLAACENAGLATPAPTTITIGGATAMRRVLQDLTAEYNRQHPDVLFVVRGGGSTIGEDLVRRGEVDLGASTLFPPEQRSEAQNGPVAADTLVRTPIGIDGLSVIVHPSNNIAELSLVQLRDLFSGRLLDWTALGSDTGEIQLVSREDGSGSRILFETRIMGEERVALTAVVMPTSREVVEYVARNPQAIGYVSRSEVAEWVPEDLETGAAMGGTALGAVQVGAPTAAPPQVKVLRVEGRLPTHTDVRSQEYALTQPLYLVANGAPTGKLRQFVDFVLSPAGQAIVDRYSVRIR
jgi:phosphate transport system substrate-binding protein